MLNQLLRNVMKIPWVMEENELASPGSTLWEPRVHSHTPKQANPLWEDMLTWDSWHLADSDPAFLNLEIARGIPDLADLQVNRYRQQLDDYAAAFRRWLPHAEEEFEASPEVWRNDRVAFRLGMLCQFLEQYLGINYKPEQREVKKISYTNPGDLFLNGVLDTREGTCGNMSVLCLSLCWRLKWPVYLAQSWWHSFCRYDDGQRTINIETSCIGEGGFSTPSDESYIRQDNLRSSDIGPSGGNLTALKPWQMLGCFFGARGRYWYDCCDARGAEADYGRASKLFPESRLWREKWTNAAGLVRSGVRPPPEMLRAAGLS